MRDAPAAPAAMHAFVRGLLEPGGVHALFQPLVRLTDGRIIGYEALARTTTDPRPPDQWLQDAERCDLRIEAELACLTAAAHHGPPPSGALLFVNVSHHALLDPRFDAVRAALPPHVLEITEHEPVGDYPALLERLRPWLAGGTLVAIDDIGSGYASMSHVLRLSPAFVKIDQALIAGIHHSGQQRSLVAALVAFARGIHATSIAEGVERAEELDILTELGIDVVQGYLLARPAPPWAAAADPVRRPPVTDVPGDIETLTAAVALTTHARDVADRITRFLARDGRMLPSIYLERGGVLRCLSRHGQWLVLDGIPAGTGITGGAFAEEREIVVTDVEADPRYRAAVPGVRAECAVPLRLDGHVNGVLNVDLRTAITEEDHALIRRCAALLESRLAEVGTGERRTSSLQELGRRAPWVASAPDAAAVADRTVESTRAITEMATAALWTRADGGALALAHVSGPDRTGLEALGDEQVDALEQLAADLTSCYSGGGVLDLAFGPMQVLREHGASSMLLAPLRDGERRVGMLCAIGSTGTNVDAEAVEAVELLCLHAGSRLAALERLAQLQTLVYRDALTGIANRTRWNELLLDRRGAERRIGWLAVADIDGLQGVNDVLGHGAGDRALQAAAAALAADPIGPDRVFRTGADEFAILLPAVSRARAETIAEQVRARAGQSLRPFRTNLSLGLTRVPPGRQGLLAAMGRADDVVHRVKRAGGGATGCDDTPPRGPAAR